jgi:hypothetical protein
MVPGYVAAKRGDFYLAQTQLKFLASLTSPDYKEQGLKELARQRALSRTNRPQRGHGEGLWPQTAQTETAPPMRGGGEGGPQPPEDRGETLHSAIGYVTPADKLAGRERTSFSL